MSDTKKVLSPNSTTNNSIKPHTTPTTHTQIGTFMLVLGIAFLCLGVMLFFDRVLLALGNLLFLGSFPLLVGWRGTLSFFNVRGQRRSRLLGVVCFLGGIALVLYGWAFVGFVLELYGAFELFKRVVKNILPFLSNIPGISFILRLPGISWVVARIVNSDGGGSDLPTSHKSQGSLA